jgi:hypothetical protein
MLLILIRPLSGTFLWPVCECSLFIAMQYRKLERARESPVLGIDNVTGTVRSTRPDFSGVLPRMSAQAVSFVTCIRWKSGSNLGLDREYLQCLKSGILTDLLFTHDPLNKLIDREPGKRSIVTD